MYGSLRSERGDFAGLDREDGLQDAWGSAAPLARRRDPCLFALAERVFSRAPDGEADQLEGRPKKAARKAWTTCFTWLDIAGVHPLYVDNEAAAGAKSIDRCACIVMLNVALGQLLSLKKVRIVARRKSKRMVQMGALTTETIEKAMAQLVASGHAVRPTVMGFLNAAGKFSRGGKPWALQHSVRDTVLRLTRGGRCWYAFGLSLVDGYHSVLLLVDCTIGPARIYWLDQNSSGVSDNVTASLDQRITEKSGLFWQRSWDDSYARLGRHRAPDTTIRLWPLRKLA